MPHTAAIRTLFLSPKPTYPLADAASLLGVDWFEMRRWVESGELEVVEAEEGVVVPWSELVSLGMEIWSQEFVEEALGADGVEVIPELVRLVELRVRVPRMQVVTLERLAADDGATVSAVLARELRDLVSVHAERMSAEAAGFAAALAWPEAP